MRQQITWRKFRELAEGYLAEPASETLACQINQALEYLQPEDETEADLVMLAKVGCLLADNFGPAFLVPFGWPTEVTAALMVRLRENGEIQRVLDEAAAELGQEPWQLAPIFGGSLYEPPADELSQRLWSNAIMPPQHAAQWREMYADRGRYKMIHPWCLSSQQVIRIVNMFSSGS